MTWDYAVDRVRKNHQELREALAALAHEQRAGWMHHLFAQCSAGQTVGAREIPPWAVSRWQRQIETPYQALSDEEKALNRIEADKVLHLVEQWGDLV